MFWKSTLIISILYSEFGDILGEKTHNKRWDRRDLVGKDPRGWTGDRTQRDLPESDPDIQIFLWISKWLFLTVWSLGQEQTALYRVALQVAPLPHGGRPSYHDIKTGIYHSLRALRKSLADVQKCWLPVSTLFVQGSTQRPGVPWHCLREQYLILFI